MKKLQNGFTLIELIIVMAVLGLLAAGLIAVLDPVEQLNRTADSGARTMANEVLRASQRYYSLTQKWPATITALYTAGELKKDVSTYTVGSSSYTMTFVTGLANASGNPTTGPFVCFTPVKSKTFIADNTVTYPVATIPTMCTLVSGVCTAATGSDGTSGTITKNSTDKYCVKGG